MNVLLGSSRQPRRWLPCMWSWCRAQLLELSGSATLSGLRWSCAIGPLCGAMYMQYCDMPSLACCRT